MEDDERWMRRAIELAARGRTSPNPMVGAVIVKRGRLVSEAYHHRAGEPHAEALALAGAGRRAAGATLYVNLEPCPTTGRTPPCTDAIIRAGVKEVVVAMRDPNHRVCGRGLLKLRRAGIKARMGPLRDEAERLNEGFSHLMRTGLPFVTVKAAISLDGKLATSRGESRWISCRKSRVLAHGLRARADAVMVGVGTVLADDPALTVRFGRRVTGREPLRVVVDTAGRTRLNSRLLCQDASPVIVATTSRAPRSRLEVLRRAGAEAIVVPVRRNRVDLRALMRKLGERGVVNVLIEGGGELISSALRDGLVDKLVIFVAPTLVGGREAPSLVGGDGVRRLADAPRLRNVTVEKCGDDLIIKGYISSICA